ncbi:hypothetical protein KIPB_005601 [Kipferlia bialata]|uniref:Uncharacterized protein n=1 Tax=Kipferlia bialata TaxID=797122 RepID=A0A9K3CX90_9EUKA|nr:hypothetical protein KIPB_005601 [Kipferlia bialata]|eukprot:g5601.t1
MLSADDLVNANGCISLEAVDTSAIPDLDSFRPVYMTHNTVLDLSDRSVYTLSYVNDVPTMVKGHILVPPRQCVLRSGLDWSAVSTGSHLYCLSAREEKHSLDMYHIDTGEWTVLCPDHRPKIDAAIGLSLLNGKILHTTRYEDWLLDPDTDTWAQLPEKPEAVRYRGWWRPPEIAGDTALYLYTNRIDGDTITRHVPFSERDGWGLVCDGDDGSGCVWNLPCSFSPGCAVPIGTSALEMVEYEPGQFELDSVYRNGSLDAVSGTFTEGPEVSYEGYGCRVSADQYMVKTISTETDDATGLYLIHYDRDAL